MGIDKETAAPNNWATHSGRVEKETGEGSVNTETKQCPECGETILAVAKKCKHCQSDLTNSATSGGAASTGSGLDIGAALLAVPVVGTLLAWFWIGNMNLLQSPGTSLALVVVATICITAILASMEASKVGATTDRKKGTYSPVQWFFLVALLWIVGYPAYLLKRRYYGLKNYLFAGLGVMVMFLGSVLIIQSSIEDRINEVKAQFGIAQSDSESLFSQFMGMFEESPEKRAKEAQAKSDAEATVTELLEQSAGVKTNVSEYEAINGEFPASCAQVAGCTIAVSVSAGGRIGLNLSSSGAAKVAGKSIVLAPSLNAAGDTITWTCVTDADFGLVPDTCHHALAELPAPATASASAPAPTPPTALAPTTSTATASAPVPESAEAVIPAQPPAFIYLDDEWGRIPQASAAELEQKLRNYEIETGGSQLGISFVNTTNGELIDAFALKLANQRGLGRKNVNDGLLLVVAVADRQMRLEVGTGLTNVITTDIAQQVVSELGSELKKSAPDLTSWTSSSAPYDSIDNTIKRLTEIVKANAVQISGQANAPTITTASAGRASPSFDCAKATTAIENMICNSDELSRLDSQLAVAYGAKRIGISDPNALKKQQQDWVRVRNQCTDANCLTAAYQSRLQELK